ncbi:hypothetical protein OPKNFCMD_1037 [Methylobacterium crusticola]|uniref:Uncharacterized protein n=1 Tax=Methylobacterium crusticola TaxID=1697972 RepID=A0ABQ4QUD8_9HYPH|nr:hypothetical protein OPKNFCMD_1037 [Methylobacterium crusticola]
MTPRASRARTRRQQGERAQQREVARPGRAGARVARREVELGLDEALPDPAHVGMPAMPVQDLLGVVGAEIRVGHDGVGKAARACAVRHALQPARLADGIGVVVLGLHVDGLRHPRLADVAKKIADQVVLADARVVADHPRPHRVGQPGVIVLLQVPDGEMRIDLMHASALPRPACLDVGSSAQVLTIDNMAPGGEASLISLPRDRERETIGAAAGRFGRKIAVLAQNCSLPSAAARAPGSGSTVPNSRTPCAGISET